MSHMSDPTIGTPTDLPAPDAMVPGGDVAPQYETGSGDDAKEKAKETAAAAKEGAKNVAGEAKQQAKALTSEATDRARGVLDQALGQAREQGSQQASRAAGGLRTFSDQARALAEGRADEAGPLGDIVTRAGDQAQQLATRLDTDGVEGVMDDVARFARRRPGLFLAAAAGLGFLAGRALRANQAAKSDDDATSYSGRYPDDYDTELGMTTTGILPAPEPGTLAGYDTGVR